LLAEIKPVEPVWVMPAKGDVLSIIQDAKVAALLASLHAKSNEQNAELIRFGDLQARNQLTPEEIRSFRSDKLVALDQDKAEFCYMLCRATNARRVVEIGTSYGVSTIYLASAVRDNVVATGGSGIVVGTEYEPAKVAAARKNFQSSGLSQFIELREGDLRETLRDISAPIDFVLVDIWISMAHSALEIVAPALRRGAIVVCDNTAQHRESYSDYFSFINNSANGFRTLTLPFDGGLEFSIYCGS
jgi:predicted O-methyltransferase YrrM